ncbi:unnamed protein product [Ostreobium quekettii]|uniref:Uncharacterized protein n=1 Tax=Ostreobium quekettii TaxID=121088 RepID=A0A8S1IXC4_9CHLO|nr:unnamed protein product [Ostreobium quekettii]
MQIRASLKPRGEKMKVKREGRAGKGAGRRVTLPTVVRLTESRGMPTTPTRQRPETPLSASALGEKAPGGTKRKRSSERPNSAPSRGRRKSEASGGGRIASGAARRGRRSSAPQTGAPVAKGTPAAESVPKGSPGSELPPVQVVGSLPTSPMPESQSVAWATPASATAVEDKGGAVNPLFDAPKMDQAERPKRSTGPKGKRTKSPTMAEQLKDLQQENARLRAELQEAKAEQKRKAQEEPDDDTLRTKRAKLPAAVRRPRQISPPAEGIRRPTPVRSIVTTVFTLSLLGAAAVQAPWVLAALKLYLE